MCAQFVHTRRRLSVHAFPTHLISMYELAYCLLRVLILLLVLAAVYFKSMARCGGQLGKCIQVNVCSSTDSVT